MGGVLGRGGGGVRKGGGGVMGMCVFASVKWNIAGKSTDMYVYVNGIVQRKVQRCIVYYMLMEQCREKYRDVCFIIFEQST